MRADIKPPLVLKVDESDATGALGIRIQSFIRSVEIRRSISDEQFIKGICMKALQSLVLQSSIERTRK